MWTDAETGDQSNRGGRAANLIDGVVRTRDDNHAWTAPVPRGVPLALSILLARNTELALLRIWVTNLLRKIRVCYITDMRSLTCSSTPHHPLQSIIHQVQS